LVEEKEARADDSEVPEWLSLRGGWWQSGPHKVRQRNANTKEYTSPNTHRCSESGVVEECVEDKGQEQAPETRSTADDPKSQALAFVEPLVGEDEQRTKGKAPKNTQENSLRSDELRYGIAEGTRNVGHNRAEKSPCCHPSSPLRLPSSKMNDARQTDEDEALIQDADDCDIRGSRERLSGGVIVLETSIRETESLGSISRR
jgi:hypothetical protein